MSLRVRKTNEIRLLLLLSLLLFSIDPTSPLTDMFIRSETNPRKISYNINVVTRPLVLSQYESTSFILFYYYLF